MVFVGYPLLVVAAGWLLYKIYVAYNSAGGRNSMDPIYDAAMYPPVMSTFGVYCVLAGHGVTWSAWLYIVLWVCLTAFAVAVLWLSQKLGDKPL